MSLELPFTDALVHAGRPDLVKTAAGRSEGYTFESRDATTMSFVHALIKNAGAETMSTCREHGAFWGITPQLQQIEQKLAAYQPEDVADQHFALIAQFDGQPVRKYAAYDGPSVFDAASAFYDDRANYPYGWRKLAASRLIGRAERWDVALPAYVETYLHKAAGLGYPTIATLENAYAQREALLPAEAADDLQKFGQLIELMTARKDLRQDDEFVKAAVELMADIDTHYGLTAHYGRSIELPEDVLADELGLPALQKQAAAQCLLANGQHVDVKKLAHDVLEAVIPGLSKMSMVELAEVLPTLPKGDADLLVRLSKHAESDTAVLDDDAAVADDATPDAGTAGMSIDQAAPMAPMAATGGVAGVTSPSIPGPQTMTAPMDMPGVPPVAQPTTASPAVQPPVANQMNAAIPNPATPIGY